VRIKLRDFGKYQAALLTGEIRAAWIELGDSRLPLWSVEKSAGWVNINGDKKTMFTGNETVVLVGVAAAK
jgi:hypothetical protein